MRYGVERHVWSEHIETAILSTFQLGRVSLHDFHLDSNAIYYLPLSVFPSRGRPRRIKDTHAWRLPSMQHFSDRALQYPGLLCGHVSLLSRVQAGSA